MGEIATAMGKPPMPHQQYIWDVALEIDPNTGLFAYNDVTLVGPRQVTGKTEQIMPVMIHRCTGVGHELVEFARREYGLTVLEPGAQRVFFTAQTADDARTRWRDVHVAEIRKSALAAMWSQPPRLTQNKESMFWVNGSSWVPGSTTGKALDVETPLWTARGWVPIGEVVPGDGVVHPGGHFIAVKGVSPVMTGHPCYRVTTSDGRTVIADAEHLWTVRDTRYGRRRSLWVTRTTEEMVEAGLRTPTNGNRFHLPSPKAVKSPDVVLPVDPYILGFWLGDGHRATNRVSVGAADLDASRRLIEETGYVVKGEWVDRRTGVWNLGIHPPPRPTLCGCGRPVRRNGMCDACSHSANRQGRPLPAYGRNSLTTLLRGIGVLGNKHVPGLYLTAGYDQRVALLQGLMDTDGSIYENHGSSPTCEFSNTNRALADAVLLLARSLGWRPTLREGRSRSPIDGRDCGPKYRVSFTATLDDPRPFRLPRKADKIRAALPLTGRRETISIKAIEPVETRPVRCIKVDSPDGLFLAGKDLVPTHNTGGTGDTIDLGVIDEAWSRVDNRTELGMRPAMMTRPWSQLWALSMVPGASRVGPEGWPWLKKRMLTGRQRVAADVRRGRMYIEFSAADRMEEVNVGDPNVWWSCMPGLGFTVPEQRVQDDYDDAVEGGKLTDFAAEYLGIFPTAEAATWSVISKATWDGLLLPNADFQQPIALGVDANRELSTASISMAAQTEDRGDVYIELVDRRGGVNWLVDAVIALARARSVCAVGIDQGGPLAGLIVPLTRAAIDENIDLTIEGLRGPQVNAACASFYAMTGETDDALPDDLPTTRRIRHAGQAEQDQSVGGVVKHMHGEKWSWHRDESTADTGPIYSATLAVAAGEAQQWLGGAYDVMESLG